jgi:hypothetical protein
MKLNKWTMLILKSVIAGFALTLLSHFVTSNQELGSSCHKIIYRGTPFSYESYESSASLDSLSCYAPDSFDDGDSLDCPNCNKSHPEFTDTPVDFMPAEFIADLVVWSGVSLVVLIGVAKLPKIKRRKKK